MKKLVLLSFILTIFYSCDKDNIIEDSLLSVEETKQVNYWVDGKSIALEVTVESGELSFVQTDNYLKFQEIMNSDNLVTYVDSNEENPMFFSNTEKYEEFISDDEKIALRRKELGRPEKLDVINLTKAGGSPTFTIGRDSRLRGGVATIPVNRYYSNRHLGYNTCITGGINFQDAISSISVDPGLRVKFYTRDDYRGKVLILDATESSSDVAIGDLHLIRRLSVVELFDSSDAVNYPICFLCASFNDVITSIAAEERGVNGYSYRNTTNVCGSSGGGGNGGGDGGGDDSPLPKEL